MKSITIAVLGIGGVGGYIGGKLAAAKLPGVRTVFIARTQTLAIIQEKGLRLITEKEGEIVVHPDLVSDAPQAIGPIDLLICAVKGYDLKTSLLPYQSCITGQTVILPFLNGIDIASKIGQILPAATVWEGIIYIVARQLEKGVVKQTGPLLELVFGAQAAPHPDTQTAPRPAAPGLAAGAADPAAALDPQAARDLFSRAGIDARVADDIDLELWRKYLFISVIATATSFYNGPMGDIRNDPAKYTKVKTLLDEAYAVAVANGIRVTEDLKNAVAQRIDKMDPSATSSMYADFQKGGQTELEALTGDVVRLGQRLNVPTPVYTDMYQQLSRR